MVALFLLAVQALAQPQVSYFEASGPACVWKRVSAKERVTLATLEGDCAGARAQWSEDGKRALVQLPKGLFEVVDGKAVLLPAVAPGDVDDFGYDAKGQIYALAVKSFDGKEVKFGGKKYKPSNAIGAPALAHTLALGPDAKAWKLLETKVTGIDACSAPGTSVLSVSAQLARRWNAVGEDTTEAQRKLLAHWTPAPPEGEWKKVADAYFWFSVFGDSLRPTGLAVAENAGKLSVIDTGFDVNTPCELQRSESWLLLTSGDKFRLIDSKTGVTHLAWSNVQGVALWR